MIKIGAIALFATLGLAACVQEPEEVSGRQAFMDNCSACHGTGGHGDGPVAASLDRVPPDLTLLEQRNNGIFPRNYVMSTIDGYSRGAHEADPMPVFGDGDLGEMIIVENPDGTGTPVPAVLLALADYLESIQQ